MRPAWVLSAMSQGAMYTKPQLKRLSTFSAVLRPSPGPPVVSGLSTLIRHEVQLFASDF
jgi:hypothetical protein